MKYQLIVGALALQALMAGAQPYSGFGEPPPVPGGTVITFDSTAPGSYSSLTVGDVTFNSLVANGAPASPFTIGNAYIGNYNTSGTESLFNGYGPNYAPDEFGFVFGSEVNNFAFNFGASDDIWELNAYSGGGGVLGTLDIAPTTGSNLGNYYGIAASGIAYATLTDLGGADWVFIDDFTYAGNGSTGNVPDGGSSMALFSLALIPLLGLGLKNRAA